MLASALCAAVLDAVSCRMATLPPLMLKRTKKSLTRPILSDRRGAKLTSLTAKLTKWLSLPPRRESDLSTPTSPRCRYVSLFDLV